MEEDPYRKKRGGRKNRKKNKEIAAGNITKKRDTKYAKKQNDNHNVYEFYEEEDQPELGHRPPPPEVEEAPEGGKFLTDVMRKKLFGKDPFKDKEKLKPAKFPRPHVKKIKNKRFAEVAPVSVAKKRKDSDVSQTSDKKPVVIESFTPEGDDYDYEELCKFEPRLKTVMVENKDKEHSKHAYTLDWKNSSTRYFLNKAILHHDYKLDYFELPEDEGLVPTVPSRREYIHWIYDLFENFESDDCDINNLCGLDIGVGASCIYPLIGVKEYGWKFAGSDVCIDSLKIAQEIVNKNHLEKSIVLKHQPKVKNLFEGVL
jgi:hypothetical protein